MKKISKPILDKVLSRSDRCALCSKQGVQLHHTLVYARKQIDEEFAILPACPDCHDKVNTDNQVKMYFEYISIALGFPELIMGYPKFDWSQRLSYLDKELKLKARADRWIKKYI